MVNVSTTCNWIPIRIKKKPVAIVAVRLMDFSVDLLMDVDKGVLPETRLDPIASDAPLKSFIDLATRRLEAAAQKH